MSLRGLVRGTGETGHRRRLGEVTLLAGCHTKPVRQPGSTESAPGKRLIRAVRGGHGCREVHVDQRRAGRRSADREMPPGSGGPAAMTGRRVAIVGLSWIAADLPAEASDPTVGTAIPYSHASAIAAIPDLDVVAGCDISPGAREVFLDRWSSRWPGLKVYADYREMLETERPEVVAV